MSSAVASCVANAAVMSAITCAVATRLVAPGDGAVVEDDAGCWVVLLGGAMEVVEGARVVDVTDDDARFVEAALSWALPHAATTDSAATNVQHMVRRHRPVMEPRCATPSRRHRGQGHNVRPGVHVARRGGRVRQVAGSGVPVSRSVLRLDSTAGQPAEIPASTGLSAVKPSW